jgi:hypothetical protein
MTDTKQPEALYFAEWLETSPYHHDKRVAAELRRLHEVNAELLEALKGLVEAYCRAHTGLTKEQRQEDHIRSQSAQKAILKAWREPK